MHKTNGNKKVSKELNIDKKHDVFRKIIETDTSNWFDYDTITRFNSIACDSSTSLSARYGVFVKVVDGSVYPSGTFKDIRNYSLILSDAGKEKVAYVHITCGNSGISLAKLCREWTERTEGRQERIAVIIIGKDADRNAIKTLKKLARMDRGKSIILLSTNLSKHEITDVQLREIALKATKGRVKPNEVRLVERISDEDTGYALFAKQIFKENKDSKAIFLPVGGGEFFYNLCREFIKLYNENNLPLPKIIGVSPKGANPFTLVGRVDETDEEYKMKVFNAPDNKVFIKTRNTVVKTLETPCSNFYPLVRKLILQHPQIEIMLVSDDEVREELKEVSRYYKIEPASATAFAGCYKVCKHLNLTENDKITIINTGKGVNKLPKKKKWWTTPLMVGGSVIVTFFATLGVYSYTWKYHWNIMHDAETRFVKKHISKTFKNQTIASFGRKESDIDFDISLRLYATKNGSKISYDDYIDYLLKHGFITKEEYSRQVSKGNDVNSPVIDTSTHYVLSPYDSVVYAYKLLPPVITSNLWRYMESYEYTNDFYQFSNDFYRFSPDSFTFTDTLSDASLNWEFTFSRYNLIEENLSIVDKMKITFSGWWNILVRKLKNVSDPD
ncbi:PLP-dependent lyase/thiolase [Candidatus Micrarchaeota archaeon]|nr:PLP-dependent lyase/thiolase [Candidatus Micrarchaeota archaeon]